MNQLLNGTRRYWALGGVLVGLISGYVATNHVLESKLTEAQAKAAQLEERAARMDQLEEKRAWHRVEEAADALLKYELKDEAGKELQERFRGEFYRWKSRYGYPQLGAGR
jgi:hypothetical protein